MPEWRCSTCIWRATTDPTAVACPHILVLTAEAARDLTAVADAVSAHLAVHTAHELLGMPAQQPMLRLSGSCHCEQGYRADMDHGEALTRAQLSLDWALMNVQRQLQAVSQSAHHADGPDLTSTVQLARRLTVLVADVTALSMICDIARGATPEALAVARGVAVGDFSLYEGWWRKWLAGDEYPWRPPGAVGFPPTVPADPDEARRGLADWRADYMAAL